ncbi:MAG TPA: aldehyde ferredoxin oxidoreductase family protein [Symbiobacteriaceae bacterium]|nr:aldehyde ferredoxin oxidoreductase family protein [Symbiobacteriaceae bacterium]
MAGGYMGRLLRVDLTTRTVTTSPLAANHGEAFLGGRGLGARLLYEEVPAGADPLGPANKLYIIAGPLTGLRIPFVSKHAIVTKSPLTSGYTRSITGGYFSAELKFAGYDGLVISGKAPTPVYLYIRDDQVEIRDAAHLWGLTVRETERRIRNGLGDHPPVRITSIGPAGEKLVRFASIVNDESRFAGRGGTGAVMGSKNLKAVVVSGTRSVPVHDPDRLEEVLGRVWRNVVSHPGLISRLRWGPMETVPMVYKTGIASVRHYSNERCDTLDTFTRDMVNNYVTQEDSCYACPHKCLKHTAVKAGPWAGTAAEGPKYELMCLFGPNCDNQDLAAIVKVNQLCADYGLDASSAGNVVAFAMECVEKGILSQEDVCGARFGDAAGMVRLVEALANRTGIGNLLAEGVRRAAREIGQGAEALAMHVKGQELGSFEPRGYPAMGLAYATSNRGACHVGPPFRLDPWWAQKNPDSPERWATTGKADVVVRTQNLYVLLDSLMFCSFSRYGLDPESYMDLYGAVTGQQLTWEAANMKANQIYSLERLFNIREGFTAQDDLLPKRFLEGPGGLPLSDMLAEYYAARGWDKEGVPQGASAALCPSVEKAGD